jgi:antitoxin (DNA-binding transcriptional repressor) of toxin-antitoxin stability system
MIIANIHKAKTDLSKLIVATLAGKEVLIAKDGVPIVKLVQFTSEKKKRVRGFLKEK